MSSNWARLARPTRLTVSPVESETRWRCNVVMAWLYSYGFGTAWEYPVHKNPYPFAVRIYPLSVYSIIPSEKNTHRSGKPGSKIVSKAIYFPCSHISRNAKGLQELCYHWPTPSRDSQPLPGKLITRLPCMVFLWKITYPRLSPVYNNHYFLSLKNIVCIGFGHNSETIPQGVRQGAHQAAAPGFARRGFRTPAVLADASGRTVPAGISAGT